MGVIYTVTVSSLFRNIPKEIKQVYKKQSARHK